MFTAKEKALLVSQINESFAEDRETVANLADKVANLAARLEVVEGAKAQAKRPAAKVTSAKKAA